MRLSFIGDVMLGRFVASKFEKESYNLISDELLAQIREADFVVANLESPVVLQLSEDSLRFAAKADLLDQFRWVNCFSLSNNHINDFGTVGMNDTIEALNTAGIGYNGLYENEYRPILFEDGCQKIAIVTCADMMNHEFDSDCPFFTLRVNNPKPIYDSIHKYKDMGYMVVVFAHVGMLFTRFPNPPIFSFLHSLVDEGADCIVTAHSHCLGTHETYKGANIFHSLGDFLMDGSSFRRRLSCMLNLEIENNQVKSWKIIPTETTMELQTRLVEPEKADMVLDEYLKRSCKLVAHQQNYSGFYKWQYKKDIFSHALSTVHFEFKRRGFWGMVKILWKRMSDVFGMIKRMVTDRSRMSYDSDAVSENTVFSNKDIE